MHDLSFLKYHQISSRHSLLIFEYLPWSLIVGRTFRIQSGFRDRHCHFNCVQNLNSLFNVMLGRSRLDIPGVWQKYITDNIDNSNPYRVLIYNPKALNNLPKELRDHLVNHPPPNPVLASNKMLYMPFKELFKTEHSKKASVWSKPNIKT